MALCVTAEPSPSVCGFGPLSFFSFPSFSGPGLVYPFQAPRAAGSPPRRVGDCRERWSGLARRSALGGLGRGACRSGEGARGVGVWARGLEGGFSRGPKPFFVGLSSFGRAFSRRSRTQAADVVRASQWRRGELASGTSTAVGTGRAEGGGRRAAALVSMRGYRSRPFNAPKRV